MASANEIADRAMELAAKSMEASTDELLQMAGDDYNLLFRASQLVRERSGGGPASGHSVEHLAFSLIAFAHDQLRQK